MDHSSGQAAARPFTLTDPTGHTNSSVNHQHLVVPRGNHFPRNDDDLHRVAAAIRAWHGASVSTDRRAVGRAD